MKFLKQADFSAETDLKERLRERLFSGQILTFPVRQQLDDDDAALINAAGDASFACDQSADMNKKSRQPDR